MSARFFTLTELHQKLDEHLRMEIRRRVPNPFRVMELKRRKLRVKDLLARITPRANRRKLLVPSLTNG